MRSNSTSLKIVNMILIAIFAMLILNEAQGQQPRKISSRDLAILLKAETSSGDNPEIKLSWAKNEQAKNYMIRRKNSGEFNFPSSYLATLDSNTFTWTDKSVEVGKQYEYEISSDSYGCIVMTFYNPVTQKTFDSTVARMYRAFGYAASGINIIPPSSFGTVLLLIDSTFADPLDFEINRLLEDLV
ncbi:MAG: C-terminal target protein, partial [Bacteroidota bacterium]|nr:C-terminal target protein [Bacteroidota bacterium]